MMFRMTTLIPRADVQQCVLLLSFFFFFFLIFHQEPVESTGGPMFRSTEPDLVQKNQVHVKFCILDLFYPFEFNGKEYS
jgi:hypothetical protein